MGVVSAGDSRARAAAASPDDGDRGAVEADEHVEAAQDDAEEPQLAHDGGVAGL